MRSMAHVCYYSVWGSDDGRLAPLAIVFSEGLGWSLRLGLAAASRLIELAGDLTNPDP